MQCSMQTVGEYVDSKQVEVIRTQACSAVCRLQGSMQTINRWKQACSVGVHHNNTWISLPNMVWDVVAVVGQSGMHYNVNTRLVTFRSAGAATHFVCRTIYTEPQNCLRRLVGPPLTYYALASEAYLRHMESIFAIQCLQSVYSWWQEHIGSIFTACDLSV